LFCKRPIEAALPENTIEVLKAVPQIIAGRLLVKQLTGSGVLRDNQQRKSLR